MDVLPEEEEEEEMVVQGEFLIFGVFPCLVVVILFVPPSISVLGRRRDRQREREGVKRFCSDCLGILFGSFLSCKPTFRVWCVEPLSLQLGILLA